MNINDNRAPSERVSNIQKKARLELLNDLIIMFGEANVQGRGGDNVVDTDAVIEIFHDLKSKEEKS